MSKPTVWRWWEGFLDKGVDGPLRDIPVRTGRKPVPQEKAGEAIKPAKSTSEHYPATWTATLVPGGRLTGGAAEARAGIRTTIEFGYRCGG